jgi:hypothetical protein
MKTITLSAVFTFSWERNWHHFNKINMLWAEVKTHIPSVNSFLYISVTIIVFFISASTSHSCADYEVIFVRSNFKIYHRQKHFLILDLHIFISPSKRQMNKIFQRPPTVLLCNLQEYSFHKSCISFQALLSCKIPIPKHVCPYCRRFFMNSHMKYFFVSCTN